MMRKSKLLPSFLVAFAITSASHASVSVALSIDDVAKSSSIAARVVPRAQTTAWENGRIVTTTRVAVERVLGGASAPSEIDIKTLGGTVGDVGQIVEGEARFTVGTPSLVFLVPRATDGALFVNGRAQGQLVIVKREGRDVVRLANPGALVDRRRVPTNLMTSLDGRDAEEASVEMIRAWERTHAR